VSEGASAEVLAQLVAVGEVHVDAEAGGRSGDDVQGDSACEADPRRRSDGSAGHDEEDLQGDAAGAAGGAAGDDRHDDDGDHDHGFGGAGSRAFGGAGSRAFVDAGRDDDGWDDDGGAAAGDDSAAHAADVDGSAHVDGSAPDGDDHDCHDDGSDHDHDDDHAGAGRAVDRGCVGPGGECGDDAVCVHGQLVGGERCDGDGGFRDGGQRQCDRRTGLRGGEWVVELCAG
jgi:hypothetical protein